MQEKFAIDLERDYILKAAGIYTLSENLSHAESESQFIFERSGCSDTEIEEEAEGYR